ncbi:MAG: DNA polymerase III subunit alpha [Deltaproteobacteria bacterium]|nr:DNA polymerase III subunit alpha [Deltaproteobacteria bacterium]
MKFVHLHVHTQYSLLDGALRLVPLFEAASRMNMDALAITDHNNLFGAIDFYSRAQEFGIKPIIGVCQSFVRNSSSGTVQDSQKIKPYEIVLLAENAEGYQNICRLVSLGCEKKISHQACVTTSDLEKYSKGVVVLSGGIRGELAQLIVQGQLEEAQKQVDWYKSIFSDRFYLEVQRHGIKLENKLLVELEKLSHSNNISLVATNNCHYLKKEEAAFHDILLCIQKGRTLAEKAGLGTDKFYLKSSEEMQKLFENMPQALHSTREIALRCQVKFDFDKFHMPHFEPPQGKNLDSYFTELANTGLRQRFEKNKIQSLDQKKNYQDRLTQEIEIICNTGFSGYFLIVADFVSFAKKKNIPVGVGRGSAVGSLVSYSLGITDIDPLKYDLIFERFLNPERISMPDVDMDFCMDRRDEVLEYVCEKYGKDKVAHIITFGTLQAKGVLRDVGRVYGLPYPQVDAIAKLVPNVLGITLKDALDQEKKLQDLKKNDPVVSKIIDASLTLEGLYRHASIHAAGVVISKLDMVNLVPLFRGKDDEIVTQYDMKSLEKLGLIKFDFLGLRTLTVIHHTVQNIRETKNPNFDLDFIPIDDAAVYKKISDGDTIGLFQFESRGMRDLCVRVKPSCLSDLIAINALFRPGPLGRVDEFIARKHGTMKVEYDLPELEEILEETYGVMLYQEQVMKIAHKIANYSLGEADLLRRAMGKKKPKEMAQQKQRFLDGAKQNHMDLKKASDIFDQMAKFAEYGFNKSHSTAYAYIGYQTAYLKHYFPLEYMSQLLSSEMEDEDKVAFYVQYCKLSLRKILPPDIYKSQYEFTVEEDSIRYGLGAIKNIGHSAISALIEAREIHKKFSSLFHLCEVVDQGVSFQKDKINKQTNLFHLMRDKRNTKVRYPNIPEWSHLQKFFFEKKTLGVYLSGHPLESYARYISWFTPYTTKNISSVQVNSTIRLGGVVESLKELRTKKGHKMAVLGLSDLEGRIEILVFSQLFEKKKTVFQKQFPLIIEMSVQRDKNSNLKLIASDVFTIEEYVKSFTRSIHIRLRSSKASNQKLPELKVLLKKYPGSCLGFVHIMKEDKEAIMQLPEDLKLQPSGALVKEVDEILGQGHIWFQR